MWGGVGWVIMLDRCGFTLGMYVNQVRVWESPVIERGTMVVRSR